LQKIKIKKSIKYRNGASKSRGIKLDKKIKLNKMHRDEIEKKKLQKASKAK
jgi:hypothetical protein